MSYTANLTTNNLLLDKLISEALRELEKLDYSARMVRRYRTVWKRLIAFVKQHQLDNKFSKDLSKQFLDQYGVRKGQSVSSKEAWRKHAVFAIKTLDDFACYGRIQRDKIDMHKLKVPPAMKKTLHDYEQYCREKRHLRISTIEGRIRQVALFMDFLRARSVKIFNEIQAIDLSEFVTSRRCFKPKTIARIVSDARLFLKFLLLRGIIKKDLSQDLPRIHVTRDASIPSVWDHEFIVKLLAVVDRSSARGKRDYAILLLACRLGLRAGDILRFTLDQINWETAAISIIQSKTQTSLCLPLTDEVGNALIDYLSSGRPNSSYRAVFLKLRAPFLPLRTRHHLHHIITYWRELAGIKFRHKQHDGTHSLRHSLATRLLEKETPFPVIADILGHASMTSTLIYAKANVEALRQVALSSEEVSHVD